MLKLISGSIAALIAAIATASSVSLAMAQDGERITVQGPLVLRTLLVAAIDSPTGEARGQLTGEVANLMSEHFRTTGPILIDVSTERRYSQPGCSRLKVRFSQDGVVLPGESAPQNKVVDIGLNYCRDGSAPKSLS